MDDWFKKRKAELEAMAPAKRGKKKEDHYAKIPLWHAALAAEAIGSPGLLVYVDLMYRGWQTRGRPFKLPNGWLNRMGASRKVKMRVLRVLEAYDMITVERRHGKSPRITLMVL